LTQARLALIASAAVCASWVAAASQPSDVETLVGRVRARVADYYQRAQRVICLERSIVQPIQPNWSADGLSRTVESELRVEAGAGDGLVEATVIRDVRRINGRAPRERDKTDRGGCTDPSPLSPEPLAFLLPSQRDEYRFTGVRDGRDNGRAALVIDFISVNRTSRPQLIEDERGHDDCFDWSGPVATRGRVWVDATTHDVLRVERHLLGPVDVRVPVKLQRRYGFDPWIVIDRDDSTVRYTTVAFTDPHEAIVLPESVDSVTVLRSGLQSTRRTETYSGYRRFLASSRVRDGDR
jgi:hypothetical protein